MTPDPVQNHKYGVNSHEHNPRSRNINPMRKPIIIWREHVFIEQPVICPISHNTDIFLRRMKNRIPLEINCRMHADIALLVNGVDMPKYYKHSAVIRDDIGDFLQLYSRLSTPNNRIIPTPIVKRDYTAATTYNTIPNTNYRDIAIALLWLKREPDKPTTLLDTLATNGHVMELARIIGYDVYGVEHRDKLIDMMDSSVRDRVIYSSIFDIEHMRYDIIILNAGISIEDNKIQIEKYILNKSKPAYFIVTPINTLYHVRDIEYLFKYIKDENNKHMELKKLFKINHVLVLKKEALK